MTMQKLLVIATLFFDTLHPDFAGGEEEDHEEDRYITFADIYGFMEDFFSQLHPDYSMDTEEKEEH